MTWTATIDRSIPGFRINVREAEGIIEFVYGTSFDRAVTSQYDTGAYTATIKNSGVTVATVPIPNHFWWCAWWWEISSVSIIRSPADLVSAGYAPPIGYAGIPIPDLIADGSVTFPGPMQSAGVTTYEPTTGYRPDIGIVSGFTAGWFLDGDARNMLEVAKSVASMPIWTWDDTPGSPTGKVIDLIVKPSTTAYGPAQSTDPNILLNLSPPDPIPGNPAQPFTLDAAHMHEICGVAAIATGAPRYVRGVQMRVLRAFDEDDGPTSYGDGTASVFYRQDRATAWMLRELFYCYWATYLAEQAGNLPADCLPSSVYRQMITNQATQFHSLIETAHPFADLHVFPAIYNDDQIAWWQQDMILEALGLLAGKFPSEWLSIYLSALTSLMARVNADNLAQWPVCVPTWYWMPSKRSDGSYINSYPELWASYVTYNEDNGFPYLSAAQLAVIALDPTNGLTFASGQVREWLGETFTALAFAVHLNRGALAGAISAVFPRLEAAYADFYTMMSKEAYLLPQASISVAPLAGGSTTTVVLSRAAFTARSSPNRLIVLAQATLAATGRALVNNTKTTVRLAQAAAHAISKAPSVTISQIWGKASKSKAPWKRIF